MTPFSSEKQTKSKILSPLSWLRRAEKEKREVAPRPHHEVNREAHILARAGGVLLFVMRYLFWGLRKVQIKLPMTIALHTVLIAAALLVMANNVRGDENAQIDRSFKQYSIITELFSTDPAETLVTETIDTNSVAGDVESDYGKGTAAFIALAIDATNAQKTPEIIQTDQEYQEGQVIPIINSSGTTMKPQMIQTTRSNSERSMPFGYTVLPGDTITGIASKFDLKATTVMWANGLNSKSTLKAGKAIWILPVDGVRHVVKKGDSLSAIASKYKANKERILQLPMNNLRGGGSLVIGKAIVVPGGTMPAPPKPKPIVSTATAYRSPYSGSSSYSGSTASTGRFTWPTNHSRMINQYYHWGHTGIDIECKYGNTINAADGGVVTSRGWYGGYGYQLTIRHDNGIVTRYAHLSSFRISNGQRVGRGQIVGMCGSTGWSTGTHLHFEVIVNGSTRNPLGYL
ncbi:peptidoglycan DD-metalloendopeptidase family protein [Patescibacteria group bacterium]